MNTILIATGLGGLAVVGGAAVFALSPDRHPSSQPLTPAPTAASPFTASPSAGTSDTAAPAGQTSFASTAQGGLILQRPQRAPSTVYHQQFGETRRQTSTRVPANDPLLHPGARPGNAARVQAASAGAATEIRYLQGRQAR